MTIGENAKRISEIGERLRHNEQALEAVTHAAQQGSVTDPILSREGYRAISGVIRTPSTFVGRTYGLLVEKALINQIPEAEIPARTRIYYGGRSPITFTHPPILPPNRYVAPADKLKAEGLVVTSLKKFVEEVDGYVEASSAGAIEELPFELVRKRIQEAAGRNVTPGAIELWREVSDVVLNPGKYIQD